MRPPSFFAWMGTGRCVSTLDRALSCCRHHYADHAADGPRDESHGHVSGQPCDCTHVQITVAWTAVTVSPEGSRSIMLPTSTALVSDADNTLAGLPQSAGNEIFFASRAVARASSRSILRC